MSDFIQYVVAELKSKRLSKQRAVHLIEEFRGHASNSGVSAVIHPLLQLNTSDLLQQCYSSKFSGAEFFLADHQVRTDGGLHSVLPGVAYLEMARIAVESALPRPAGARCLELRDTVWLQPLIAA